MASIRGRYEYDDNSLTPGKKREGGLHQNLFDKNGSLKGSARFIPDENDDPGSYPEPVVIYVNGDPADDPRDATAELVAQLVLLGALRLVAAGTPHAKRLWLEKALPAIRSKRAQLGQRRPLRRGHRSQDGSEILEATVVEPAARALVDASAETRTDMTSSEAQARYLLALAARRFSDERLQVLADVDIAADNDVLVLQRALAELPAEQVTGMLRRLEADPSLLTPCASG